MPRSGHQKLIWSSGKEELDVSVLDFVSICAAELASKGEAMPFGNKVTLETSPRAVYATADQTGEVNSGSTERRFMKSVHAGILGSLGSFA